MTDLQKEMKELQKGCRKSKQAIPIEAAMLVVVFGMLWLLERFLTISLWVKVIVIGMLLYGLVGDILNVYFCNRRLRKLEAENGHVV